MSAFTSLAGHLLIAMPGIGDPRFEQAVILLCVHQHDHAMGLRLNRPAPGVDLHGVLARLDIACADAVGHDPVLIGGPVERERGFVLHSRDWMAPDVSLEVTGDLALTATREALVAMADPADGPAHAVLALGYAGWGEGQIEDELAENVWLVAQPDLAIIFDAEPETKWVRALASVGVDAANLSTQIGNA